MRMQTKCGHLLPQPGQQHLFRSGVHPHNKLTMVMVDMVGGVEVVVDVVVAEEAVEGVVVAAEVTKTMVMLQAHVEISASRD